MMQSHPLLPGKLCLCWDNPRVSSRNRLCPQQKSRKQISGVATGSQDMSMDSQGGKRGPLCVQPPALASPQGNLTGHRGSMN